MMDPQPDRQDAVLGGQTSGSQDAVLGGLEQVDWPYRIHQSFREPLPNGIGLEMVALPADRFLMGSPEEEGERESSEGPQHEVTVPKFFIGKYPITQAQWRAVAELPEVMRSLTLDPSRFQGDHRPVENISWFQAVEFCERLSEYTERPYRLAREAEWEYACRAGTPSPFYFGETITPDLANYDSEQMYGTSSKGARRDQTTEVGRFPPNEFDLYDLHGNVWEWCVDDFNPNYQGAPTDGGAWVTGANSPFRVLRGGSWLDRPGRCRSAARYGDSPFNRFPYVGFRVVCSAH
ncbi:MAG: formylglycine-generating enzyme family protein [Leptolyngbyaceae cyanobacterium bins.59]|nr:formylglycine-generating enzyme family protein [Leptolyngbyaceae cyanobacterium bins.59]